MKRIVLFTALTASMLAAPIAMADRTHYRDARVETYARVTHVEPIYRSRVVHDSHDDCRHTKRHRHDKAAGGMILGGLAGSAIAGEIHGSTGSRIAGAVVGSALGHDLARGERYETRDCRPSHTERYIDGYRVTYRYRGHNFVTRSDHHPGKRIRVIENVERGHHRR